MKHWLLAAVLLLCGALKAQQIYQFPTVTNQATVDAGNIATGVLDPTRLLSAPLATPSAPTVTTHGTPGTTTYGYVVAFRSIVGSTDASAEGSVATGNATLSATNYNIVTPPTCSAGAVSVDVWRNSTDGGVYVPVRVGNVTCGGSINDTGAAPADVSGIDFAAPPTVNRSGGLGIATNFSVAGHSAFVNAVPDLDTSFLNGGNSIGVNVLMTEPASFMVGISSVVELQDAAGNGGMEGFYAEARTAESNTQNLTGDQYGNIAIFAHLGSGTVSKGIANSAQLYNLGSGIITAGIGQRISVTNSGAGSIGTAYGLSIDAITTASTNYAIYTNAGQVRLGDTVTAPRIMGNTSAPGVSGCGAIQTGSNDLAGAIKSGTAGACVTTVTFTAAYPTAPFCVAANNTTGAFVGCVASTGGLVITGTTLVDDIIAYHVL